MSTVILACKTIQQELLAAMEQVGCSWPVLWVESGLHNWPGRLRGAVQGLLGECVGADTVVLAMSLCGNALVGLETGDFSLILPRCDDCVTLLLGSRERRAQLPATYFLTEGWLKGERNLWEEYQHARKKYGKDLARQIFADMLAHYRHIALVDTGAYDLAAVRPQFLHIARELELEPIYPAGTLDYLKALLSPPWDEDQFLTLPPHTTLTQELCQRNSR